MELGAESVTASILQETPWLKVDVSPRPLVIATLCSHSLVVPFPLYFRLKIGLKLVDSFFIMFSSRFRTDDIPKFGLCLTHGGN